MTTASIHQKFSVIHNLQVAALENEYVIDNKFNMLPIKEANPSYYNAQKTLFESFQILLDVLHIAVVQEKPEAAKEKLKELFSGKEKEFSDLIISLVIFSEKVNQKNEDHKSLYYTLTGEESNLQIEKIDNLLNKTNIAIQNELSGFLEVIYEAGSEMFSVTTGQTEDF